MITFILNDNRWLVRTRNDRRFVNKPVIMWSSFLFGDISLLILAKGANLEIYVLKKEKVDFSSFVLVLRSCLFKSTIFFPSSCLKISCEGKWINSVPVYFRSVDKAMVPDSTPTSRTSDVKPLVYSIYFLRLLEVFCNCKWNYLRVEDAVIYFTSRLGIYFQKFGLTVNVDVRGLRFSQWRI